MEEDKIIRNIINIGKIYNVEFMIENPDELLVYINLYDNNCKVQDSVFIINNEKILNFTILNIGLVDIPNGEIALQAMAKSNNICDFLQMDIKEYFNNTDRSLLSNLLGSEICKCYYLRRIK